MKKGAQIEDIIVFLVTILLVLSALVYFVYFKTGVVPVYKPPQKIEPAKKSVIPTGTFFIYPEKQPEKQLPFNFFVKKTYAQSKKLKPNKNIETYIFYDYPDLSNIETNEVQFTFQGKNLTNSNDRFYFIYILYPLERDWKVFYFSTKYFNLPKGYNRYLLIVSAVNQNDEYDPSPAYLFFTTKISPYFKDVSLSPQGNKLTLYLYNNTNKEINITNWKIVSSQGIYSVPEGVNYVDPDYKYKKEKIILPPYGKAKIIATSSPLGFSFRINKCLGYFLNLRRDVVQFVDYVPYYCKYFSRNELFNLRKQGYSIKCLDFLSSISCPPRPQVLKTIEYDSKCMNLIDNLYSYKGCYYNNLNSPDFLAKDWLIFIQTPTTTIYVTSTNRYKEIPKTLYETRYEEIRLYDENNLLVNNYIYY